MLSQDKETNMEDPRKFYQVFVGGGSPAPSGPNWFSWLKNLKNVVWPPHASKRRKIVTFSIPIGVLLIAGTVAALVVMNSSNGPLTVPSEEVEEGLKVDTNGDGDPDTVIPDDDSSVNGGDGGNDTTNPGGQSAQNGGGNGGNSDDHQDSGGNNNNGGNGGPASCALPKYPNPSCVGVPFGTNLTTHNGDFVTTANGQVINALLITGDLEVWHDNVVIDNSTVLGHVKNYGGTQATFTIEDSTVGPADQCFHDPLIRDNNYTATRVYFRGSAEGARVEWPYENGPASESGNVTVRDSYFKFCNPGGDAHADALQGYHGGTNIIFEHNTVDYRAIDPQLDYMTAAVFWAHESGNNVLYKDNLISGGAFTIRFYEGTGHTVTGNKVINNTWLYGPVDSYCGTISNWSDNNVVEVDNDYNITSVVGSLTCVGG